MSRWTKAWLGWGFGFAVIEALALRDREQRGTLSELIRTVFGFDSLGPAPRARRLVFLGFWFWFGAHIALRPHGCVFPDTPPIPPS